MGGGFGIFLTMEITYHVWFLSAFGARDVREVGEDDLGSPKVALPEIKADMEE